MSTVRDRTLEPWGFEEERKGETNRGWERRRVRGECGREKETDKNSSHIRNTQVFVRSNVNISFDPVFL